MSFLIAHLSHMNKLLKEYKQDQLTTTNPSTSTEPHVLRSVSFFPPSIFPNIQLSKLHLSKVGFIPHS